jgi:glucose/arabinose dehydrogenase
LFQVALVLFTATVVGALSVFERLSEPASAGSDFDFTRGSLGIDIDAPTSLAFGPDGRLYVASWTEIQALTLNAMGDSVVSSEQIAAELNGVLGIAFDPTTGNSPMTLYASGQDESAPAGYQGVITKLTAPGWQREDVITGLPTSAPLLNHLTNGIAFDNEGRLLIAQGSSTDSGLANPGFATYWNETPLSAAILVADVHAPGFDGDITYSDGPPDHDNIDQTGGDVSVFASGTRNPYDLVVHTNGLIYATDNGPLGRATSLDCETGGGTSSVADELNLIEEGNYYGAPNRNRGRTDPRQCIYRAPQLGDGPDYTGPIATLPGHCSCDGMAEYTASRFSGALQGNLIIAEFIRGNVSMIELSEDGRSVVGQSELEDDFEAPLDIAVSDAGGIYIADYEANGIWFLLPDEGSVTPVSPTPSPTAPLNATATPTRTAQPTTVTPTPFDRAGDVNCDGSINSIDSAIILQFTAALLQDFPCKGNPDASGDGEVTAVDAALVLQYNAGLIGHLPP